MTAPSSEPRVPTVDDFPETGTNALATFGQRAGARVLDTMIILGPLMIVVIAASVDWDNPDAPVEPVGWFPYAWVVLAGAYEVILISLFGTTVGKVAFGTRIARFADGATPTWEQSFLRCLLPLSAAAVLYAVNGPAVIGAAIVYFSVFSSPLARGWHDLAGGTVVIRTR